MHYIFDLPKSKPRLISHRGRVAHVIRVWELDTELPDYLTPAGRPVKDHFGSHSSITSTRVAQPNARQA